MLGVCRNFRMPCWKDWPRGGFSQYQAWIQEWTCSPDNWIGSLIHEWISPHRTGFKSGSKSWSSVNQFSWSSVGSRVDQSLLHRSGSGWFWDQRALRVKCAPLVGTLVTSVVVRCWEWGVTPGIHTSWCLLERDLTFSWTGSCFGPLGLFLFGSLRSARMFK